MTQLIFCGGSEKSFFGSYKNQGVVKNTVFKGEVHPKRNISYLVVFGVLSRVVKVRGACDRPFLDIQYMYKRLNNCAAWDSACSTSVQPPTHFYIHTITKASHPWSAKDRACSLAQPYPLPTGFNIFQAALLQILFHMLPHTHIALLAC